MREHVANAAYGLMDYAAYPIGMLLVAPVVLRNMGAARYGEWAVTTAIVSMGSIIASGFGDAHIKHVAGQRGAGDMSALVRTVRCKVGINLATGTILAAVAWLLAPYAASHLGATNAALQRESLWSLRLASIIILLRALENVCISTQRAFERYGAAVRISILARVFSLIAAGFLAVVVHSVMALVVATLLLTLLGTWLQFSHLRRMLQTVTLSPVFDRTAFRALMSFGAFTWIQAVAAVAFSQADRLLLGVSLGAGTVAAYALCSQMAQPIYGLAAAGLHFLFPYLASRLPSHSQRQLRGAVLSAFVVNALFIASSFAGLVVFGPRILHLWAGRSIAENSVSLLPLIGCSYALAGLSVTATYALTALGRVRVVTWLNLAGGAAMLLLMAWLLPRFGARGLAMARLSYGALALLLYLPLALQLKRKNAENIPAISRVICEEA